MSERRTTMAAQETGNAKYNIACAEIVPDCPFTASALTEEELVKLVAAHAEHDHGIKEVSPELAAKVKSAIRTR
jgi:predicted small metal-binding protein